MHVFLQLETSLFFGFNQRKNVCVGNPSLSEVLFFLFVQALTLEPEEILVEFSERVLLPNEAQLSEEDRPIVILLGEEEFLSSLTVLRARPYKLIDFVYSLDQLSTYPLVEPDLLLCADFSLDLSDDLGVREVVSAACFFDALDQRMVDQSSDVLLPTTTLREELLHHLTLQSVG